MGYAGWCPEPFNYMPLVSSYPAWLIDCFNSKAEYSAIVVLHSAFTILMVSIYMQGSLNAMKCNFCKLAKYNTQGHAH